MKKRMIEFLTGLYLLAHFFTPLSIYCSENTLYQIILKESPLTETEAGRFINMVKEQLNENKADEIQTCEISILPHSRGFKITTQLSENKRKNLQSYVPLNSVKDWAKMAAQDIIFLNQKNQGYKKIQPILEHSFSIKYFQDIFPELGNPLIPLSIKFFNNQLIISHQNGLLHLIPPFILSDESYEDLYNWNNFNPSKSSYYFYYEDFILSVSDDFKSLNKNYFSGKALEKIPLNLENSDFIFTSEAWELSTIQNNQLIQVNLNDHSINSVALSIGYISAAYMKNQNIWVYDTMDKRLHQYNKQGKWINSLRPMINDIQSPFDIVALDNDSFVICDYGRIYYLDPNGKIEWMVEDFIEKEISYALPNFFSPAFSDSEKELYILDHQNSRLLFYNLSTDYTINQNQVSPNNPLERFNQYINQDELLAAWQWLFNNQDYFDSHQYQLQQKSLSILVKKQLCKALLARSKYWEANLCLQRAANLLSYYLEENKILQKWEPLDPGHQENFHKALILRNDLNQRIGALIKESPLDQGISIKWQEDKNNNVTGSLEINSKNWSLPATITLKIPGMDQVFKKNLNRISDLKDCIIFKKTEELKEHCPIRISLQWPNLKKEYLWEFILKL